jgi:hypothetical protein
LFVVGTFTCLLAPAQTHVATRNYVRVCSETRQMLPTVNDLEWSHENLKLVSYLGEKLDVMIGGGLLNRIAVFDGIFPRDSFPVGFSSSRSHLKSHLDVEHRALRNFMCFGVRISWSISRIVCRGCSKLLFCSGGNIGNGEDNPLKIVDILVTLLPPPIAMTLTNYRGLRSCYSGANSTRQEFCQTNFIYLLFSSNLNQVRSE